MYKSQKSKSRKGSKIPRNRNGGPLSHPPPLSGTQLKHAATLRYQCKTSFSGAITFQNLLDSYLVATTAVAGSQVFQTVKIRRVRVWAIAAIGLAQAITLEFSGVTAGVSGDQVIHSDTSMGVTPARISARPNAKSLASDYQLSSAAVAFNLTVPVGAVIDLELSFRGQFAASTAVANALVGATAGAFYLRSFDGLATAASNFTPELGGAVQQ